MYISFSFSFHTQSHMSCNWRTIKRGFFCQTAKGNPCDWIIIYILCVCVRIPINNYEWCEPNGYNRHECINTHTHSLVNNKNNPKNTNTEWAAPATHTHTKGAQQQHREGDRFNAKLHIPSTRHTIQDPYDYIYIANASPRPHYYKHVCVCVWSHIYAACEIRINVVLWVLQSLLEAESDSIYSSRPNLDIELPPFMWKCFSGPELGVAVRFSGSIRVYAFH